MGAQPKRAENTEKDSRKDWLTGLSVDYQNSPPVTVTLGNRFPHFARVASRDFFLRGKKNIGQTTESRVCAIRGRELSSETSSSGHPDDDVTGNVWSESEFQRAQRYTVYPIGSVK